MYCGRPNVGKISYDIRPDSKKIQRLYSSALRLPLALPNLDAAATDITHLLHRRKHQIPYPFSAINNNNVTSRFRILSMDRESRVVGGLCGSFSGPNRPPQQQQSTSQNAVASSLPPLLLRRRLVSAAHSLAPIVIV